MVRLEEVEDEEFNKVQIGEKAFNDDDDDFTDTGKSYSSGISLHNAWISTCSMHFWFLPPGFACPVQSFLPFHFTPFVPVALATC